MNVRPQGACPVRLSLAVAMAALVAACTPPRETADLIVLGGTVWTGNPDRPRAEAVAARGDEILAVGSEREVLTRRGPETRVLNVEGRFVAPGFVDSHTHFERAGALLLGVNLLAVSSEGGLVDEVRAARDRLPEGSWITGGDWGAYAEWGRGSAGRGGEPRDEEREEFRPDRTAVDSVTPANPVVLRRWDGDLYLANSRALEVAGANCSWEGVECRGGRPTGRLAPGAAKRVLAHRPPRPRERRLAEARRALERLRSLGVTTVHDITGPEQFRVFQELEERGQLTVRVYARPTLDKWDALARVGLRRGFGGPRLQIGGLKGFVDGIMGNSSARFYEPYLTTGERGRWREMMEPAGNMQRLMLGADSSGHSLQVHAIGNQAIDTLLDLYEHVQEVNPPRDRRYRVIHAQVLRDGGVAGRMAELGAVAEMQPYHAIDDMRWMEKRIGAERSRWAYAFRTIHEAGVRLAFGSDWPGTNASWYPADPILGIYAAVSRKTLQGTPEGGWFPEERIDVETALRAYTVNNAWAAGNEDVKGSLEPGKVADVVVLDRSPFEVEADSLKNLKVLYTILGGEVIFRRDPGDPVAARQGLSRPGEDGE